MAGLLSPDPVAETLQRWAAEPFEWGRSDCALSVLDHAERVTGFTLHLQADYTGQHGAMRLLRTFGGFEQAFGFVAGCFAAIKVDCPERGDVGLVEVPGSGLTACLCIGPGTWAAKGHREAVIFPAQPAVAWRLPCPRP